MTRVWKENRGGPYMVPRPSPVIAAPCQPLAAAIGMRGKGDLMNSSAKFFRREQRLGSGMRPVSRRKKCGPGLRLHWSDEEHRPVSRSMATKSVGVIAAFGCETIPFK